VTTRPHLGGLRWWFVCPLIVGGCACGRRCAKLYLHGQFLGPPSAARYSDAADARGLRLEPQRLFLPLPWVLCGCIDYSTIRDGADGGSAFFARLDFENKPINTTNRAWTAPIARLKDWVMPCYPHRALRPAVERLEIRDLPSGNYRPCGEPKIETRTESGKHRRTPGHSESAAATVRCGAADYPGAWPAATYRAGTNTLHRFV
jgi:hypothetical protein